MASLFAPESYEIAALAARLAEPGEVYARGDGLQLVDHVAAVALDRYFPRRRGAVDTLSGEVILRPQIESLEAKMALIATSRRPIDMAGWRFGFRRLRRGWRICEGLSMMRVRESVDPEAAEAFVLTVVARAPSILFWRRRARKGYVRSFWRARDGRVFEEFKHPD